MNIVFYTLVFIFSQLGELSTLQGLVALVTGAGLIKDPVHAFVILGSGLIGIGVLGVLLPNEFDRLKSIAAAFRAKIQSTADLKARLDAAEAKLKEVLPLVTAANTTATAASAEQLATGEKP